MSDKIHRSNNRGLIYNGFLLPSFTIKFQKGDGNKVGDFIITKPSLGSALTGIDTRLIKRLYNQTPYISNQAELDVAIIASLKKRISSQVKDADLAEQILAEMMKEYKKDRDDQEELLKYSKANPLNSSAANKVMSYNSEVKSAVQARGQKMEALQKVQGEAKEALETQQTKARAKLRGEAKKQKDLAEAAQRQRLIDAIEQAKLSANDPKSFLAGYDATIIGEVAKKYIQQGKTAKEFNDNIAEDVRKTQGEIDLKGARASRLQAQRTQQPIPAAAPAAAGSDGEYEAPDSQVASAPVAPAPSNLNPGAGSQAPIFPGTGVKLGTAYAGGVVGSAMGRAFRRRQANQQAAAAQGAVDDAAAEQVRQAGMRNVAETIQPPPQDVSIAQNTFEGVDQEQRTQQIGLQITEQEKADETTKTDDNLDVSKYGYDKQISIFAIQENRDFTYTKEQIKASTPNLQEGLMEALKMWGYTIEISKPKTNDYDEACEIRTFIFLAKEKYSLERQWKKALVQLPSALQDIGMTGASTAAAAGGTNTQMGILTQFANPQVISNIVQQAAQGAAAGRAQARAARRGPGAPPPAPPMASAATSMGGFPPRPPQPPPTTTTTEAPAQPSATDDDGDEDFGSAESSSGSSSDDQFRRRLTGFGRNVSYSSRPDGKIYRAGERQAEALQNVMGVSRTERVQGGGQGVQRVRVARASQPRPQRKGRRIDTRPKMNLQKTQFKLRASRINPNLLFTNLTKQNPNPVGMDSIFKLRRR